jgi:hypothetical protein
MEEDRVMEDKIHPAIERLVAQEFPDQSTENAQYWAGWVTARAGKYFAYRMSQLDSRSSELTEELCAEIGFWQALVDRFGYEVGRQLPDLPTSTNKVS